MDGDAHFLRTASQQSISKCDQFGCVAALQQTAQQQKRLVLPAAKVPAEVDNQRAHAQASPGLGHDRSRQFLAREQPAQFSVLGVDVFRGHPGDQPAAPPVEHAQLEHQLLEKSPGRGNDHCGTPTSSPLREHVFGCHVGDRLPPWLCVRQRCARCSGKDGHSAARPVLPASTRSCRAPTNLALSRR